MSILKSAQWEFLKDITKLILFIESKGYSATGGEYLRTPEQEAIYQKQGLSHTNHSRHLVKLAFDISIFDPNNNWLQDKHSLQFIGDYWESLDSSNIWGGNFPSHYPGSTFIDCPHFERKPPTN